MEERKAPKEMQKGRSLAQESKRTKLLNKKIQQDSSSSQSNVNSSLSASDSVDLNGPSNAKELKMTLHQEKVAKAAELLSAIKSLQGRKGKKWLYF